MKIEEIVLKHALINAIKHNGKAKENAIIGKVIAEFPEAKKDLEKLKRIIKEKVEFVNSLSLEEQIQKAKELNIEIEKKKKIKEYELPELPNAKKRKVVMRLAPYPSGPLHIGNARMVILNDEYVKRYNGKLLLVYDDTIGSKEKFVIKEAYDLIKDGLDWLGVKVDEIYYKSDRLEIFYEYAEKLIKLGKAYVCTCPVEKMRENRKKGIECECRKRSIEENLKLWKDMLNGKFKEGEAVLRLKTSMKHPNPAFRDRVLMRIAERQHPRVGKKYKVWPMLEFSWAIDDHLLGITHILRGKDLIIEDMMEEEIWKIFGWPKIEFIHYGLLSFEGVKLSKTEARKKIEAKEYEGWDDPRTWSLQSLRKRGFLPQAIRNFVLRMGLSLADVKVPLEILYAENRKLIDPIANRYFVVLNPKEIKLDKEIGEVKIPLHPDFEERGKRKVFVGKKVFVEKEDFENFEGKVVGLAYIGMVEMKENAKLISKEIDLKAKKIQWVSEEFVKVKIVFEDGSRKEGIGEINLLNVKEGDIIQMVRIGFGRINKIDKNKKELLIYFAHK
ncbi:MAG: glutamate--tRNA ligase [Candidatus Aenigmarchaeota archaeon ex4484_224]|nr:MAG: glutamate--tRNA ligase [Candidatus Aenigmarchaeota archaeon ex4484_224]